MKEAENHRKQMEFHERQATLCNLVFDEDIEDEHLQYLDIEDE